MKPFIQPGLAMSCRAVGASGPSPPPPFLADQLTSSQPGWADYAQHITTCPPRFNNLPTTLGRAYCIREKAHQFNVIFFNSMLPEIYYQDFNIKLVHYRKGKCLAFAILELVQCSGSPTQSVIKGFDNQSKTSLSVRGHSITTWTK